MTEIVQTITSAGEDSWTCPGGVTEVVVECWGGGGGGGRGYGDQYYGGSGGGGGAYSKKTVVVAPASVYDYAVGAAGNANGGTGGDTWFSSTETVLAKGGAGGKGGTTSQTGGAGGAAASGVGDTKYSGGAGASNYSFGGGGGGGSAGTAANGNAGSGTSGGAAVTGGGPGGAGSSSGAGHAPTSGPGGGGGGGDDSLAKGGAGWAGQLRLTYTIPPAYAPTITAPADGYTAVPATIIDLTAEGYSGVGGDVYYRFKYSKDGGADQTIGDTDPTTSGDPETYVWDTDGLDTGVYVIKCWTVDDYDQPSEGYDSITIYLGYAFILAPDDLDSEVADVVAFTGKGYALTAGDVVLTWELDTDTPPSAENDDYTTWQTDPVAQGEAVTTYATIEHHGTWYYRVKADLDE